MEKQGQCGVYELFKLGKGVGNTFTTDYKTLERPLHVVMHDYADLINSHSTINGSLYVYNEVASKLYWQKKPYDNPKEFTAFEEVKEDYPQEFKEDDLISYRDEYETLSGKKAHHLWKEDKLIEKIEELKK
jgi:hypothetical protein